MDGEFEVVNNQGKFLKQIVCSTVSGDGPATLYDRALQATMTSSNGNIFRVTGPLCGNSPVTGKIPTQRPVTRSFYASFDLRLN